MPGGDGTGPVGMGPMTGRGAGFCAGYASPGYANPGFAGPGGFRGRGRGGGGRGRRNRFFATGLTGWQRASGVAPYGVAPQPTPQPAPAQQLDALKAQADYFQDALEQIRARIQDLESDSNQG